MNYAKMSLSHEHVGPKILAKIKIYVLTRAELLFPLCYEIPCIRCTKAIGGTGNIAILGNFHLERRPPGVFPWDIIDSV